MPKRTPLDRISLASAGTVVEVTFEGESPTRYRVQEMLDDPRRGRGARLRVDGAFDDWHLYDDEAGEGTTIVAIHG